jgi:hypothetical protein
MEAWKRQDEVGLWPFGGGELFEGRTYCLYVQVERARMYLDHIDSACCDLVEVAFGQTYPQIVTLIHTFLEELPSVLSATASYTEYVDGWRW